MEMWRYLRDVLIVVGVLLLFTGLLVGWGLCAVLVILTVAFSSMVDDFKRARKK